MKERRGRANFFTRARKIVFISCSWIYLLIAKLFHIPFQNVPNLDHIREMLNRLFAKLPACVTPFSHLDQSWQYQNKEYMRLLFEHNITQSMSRKGNCLDNFAMENFFGRLNVKIFYGEKFKSVNSFIYEFKNYIYYYNNDIFCLNLKE